MCLDCVGGCLIFIDVLVSVGMYELCWEWVLLEGWNGWRGIRIFLYDFKWCLGLWVFVVYDFVFLLFWFVFFWLLEGVFCFEFVLIWVFCVGLVLMVGLVFNWEEGVGIVGWLFSVNGSLKNIFFVFGRKIWMWMY